MNSQPEQWQEGEEHSLTRRQEWDGGEIWMEARVVQGGNDLWTPCVLKFRRGRRKKIGAGYIAGTMLACAMHPKRQTTTREEAKRWCDEAWKRLEPRSTPTIEAVRARLQFERADSGVSKENGSRSDLAAPLA